MTATLASTLTATLASTLLASSSCTPTTPASAAVDVELAGLAGVSATLSIVDDAGAPAVFDVKDAAGELLRADGEVAVACVDRTNGVLCSTSLVLDPGAYRFTLAVAERDRCGAQAVTLSLSSGDAPIALDRGDDRVVTLFVDRTDFDDDGDGIVNALERAVCGRFDVADGGLPPQTCVDGDACCDGAASALEGQRSVFAGGAHTRADGSVVDVAPFALDATELTWATLSRCVAAGACLAHQPDHAVRVQLDDAGLDRHAPVTGLSPREASELCAWHGGRLPDDDEWDFAAAARAGGGRARYPFDVPVPFDGAIGCVDGAGVVAANHAARAQSCPSGPVAVGSYPSTYVERGAGSALADLAGNAGEWTVRRDGTGTKADTGSSRGSVSTTSPFPDDVIEVDVRGGSAGGIVELLENDVVLRVTRDASDVEDRLRGLAETTGVRCAFAVDDLGGVDAAAAPVEEPACGVSR